MPNIASVLKAEISRIARKELRTEVDTVKKTVAAQRAEIAGLKKRLLLLERQVKAQARASGRRPPEAAAGQVAEPDDAAGLRFRAAGMASNRKRLGLSAHDFGRLVGATGQSVYAWESGKSKPAGRYLGVIAALRGLGKREVAAKLLELDAQ